MIVSSLFRNACQMIYVLTNDQFHVGNHSGGNSSRKKQKQQQTGCQLPSPLPAAFSLKFASSNEAQFGDAMPVSVRLHNVHI
jgi:hypothetical protein